MKRFTVSLLCLLFCAMILSSCSAGSKLVGTWDSDFYSIEFTKDTIEIKSFGVSAGAVPYSTQGSNIIFKQGAVSVEVPFVISGDVLTIEIPGLPKLELKRAK